MRKPASPTRVLTVASYAVCMVWAGMGVLIALRSLGAMVLGHRHASGPPDWIFGFGCTLSVLVVGVVWTRYRRGELDEYDIRRHRDGARSSGARPT